MSATVEAQSMYRDLWKLFFKSCALLSRRDQRLLLISATIQLSLIFLDILGLLIVGGVATIITSAIQGKELPRYISSFINLLNLTASSPQFTTAILGTVAASCLVLKSITSYYFGLKNFAFLARREARVSEALCRKIFKLPISELNRFPTASYQHALTIGSSSVLGGVIGQVLMLMTELMLQISMLITLFVFSPSLTLILLIFFVSLFYLLNWLQGKKAKLWGKELTKADIGSTSLISDTIGSFREITVSGKRDYFINEISHLRNQAATIQVNKSMLTQFSKYAFEIAVILSVLAISAFAFLTRPAIEAASLVAIFMTASMRIASSLLKLQQGILQLKGAAGATVIFFEIDQHASEKSQQILQVNKKSESVSEPLLVVRDLSFTFPGNDLPSVKNISFEVSEQSSIAIVGPSGAGKSTLVDALLGLIPPDSGIVQIAGVTPSSLHGSEQYPIAYVPQHVHLRDASILENVALGVPLDAIDEELAWESLKKVHLDSWVKNRENGIRDRVGERGSRLSGGQRQRIGIARALYRRPKLLVLDEATSALDAESENDISQSINNIHENLSLIVIAHRLSTVIASDRVMYMENGRVIAEGTFEKLRELVPNFDRQANLMGIAK